MMHGHETMVAIGAVAAAAACAVCADEHAKSSSSFCHDEHRTTTTHLNSSNSSKRNSRTIVVLRRRNSVKQVAVVWQQRWCWWMVSATMTVLLFGSSSQLSLLTRYNTRLRRCGVVAALSMSAEPPRHKINKSRAAANQKTKKKRIAVIGGGASGIFASIHAAAAAAEATTSTAAHVTVLEAGSQTLTKVKISGGGRCNVLHDASKPAAELLAGYPRGHKELRGLLSRHFPVTAAAAWFQSHGVALKTEPDGRMFPVTDSSQTVVDALLAAAHDASVDISLRTKVDAIVPPRGGGDDDDDDDDSSKDGSFQVTYTIKGEGDDRKTATVVTGTFDAVILATGSAPAGYALVRRLRDTGGDVKNNGNNNISSSSQPQPQPPSLIEHSFVETVPSLFTLNCKHAVKEGQLLYGLSGVSVPKGRVSFKLQQQLPPPAKMAIATTTSDTTSVGAAAADSKLQRKKTKWIEQEGPLLITHHGLSGPAALRLSAFGARDFGAANYRGELMVHWAPDLGSTDSVFDQLWTVTASNPKKTVSSQCPLFVTSLTKDGSISAATTAVPKRLWSALVQAAGIEETLVWGQASKKLVRSLAEQVAACPLELTGKGTFKEEFVTAGGVDLSAVDMKTMQSKTVPGLFFCGELINVDGVTGGFNFLNCWATGYVAGTSAASYVQTL